MDEYEIKFVICQAMTGNKQQKFHRMVYNHDFHGGSFMNNPISGTHHSPFAPPAQSNDMMMFFLLMMMMSPGGFGGDSMMMLMLMMMMSGGR